MTVADFDAGVLVLCAEDMFRADRLRPADDPRISATGWEVVAYLFANDDLFQTIDGTPAGKKVIKEFARDDIVFYGFLAKRNVEEEYFVAIRGTARVQEWLDDANFPAREYPGVSGATVEYGFYDILKSMTLVGRDRGLPGVAAARGISDSVGAAPVTVGGHSLGSALATYLSLALAEIGSPVLAVMFASPRTGNQAFVDYYQSRMAGRYRLYNYILDAVTYVPFSVPPLLDYETLRDVTLITPESSQADIKLDLACHHHLVCYLAMIDYASFAAMKRTDRNSEDLKLFPCVLAPHETSLNYVAACALAELVAHSFGEMIVKKLLVNRAKAQA